MAYDKKRMQALEKHLQKQFPQCSIHVRPDANVVSKNNRDEFVISGENVTEIKEQVWAAAEEFLGEATWGKPHYAG